MRKLGVPCEPDWRMDYASNAAKRHPTHTTTLVLAITPPLDEICLGRLLFGLPGRRVFAAALASAGLRRCGNLA
eukprot:8746334-Alexandrium_andersonii.AAC.1